MAGCRTPGSLGAGCNQPVIDRGTTARTEHQPPGTLRSALIAAPLLMTGPAGAVLGSAYVLGQVYYRDNLAALSAASERALMLAPAAIAEATGFDDLGKLLDTVLKGLLAALIGLGATTALGAAIGGIVGFFFGGAGAAPGAVAGAKLGFDVGVAILTWLGLGFLITSIGQGLGELAAMLTQGIRRAWEAGNSKSEGGRATEIDSAAKDLAKAIGILIRLILEGILAYLMRGAPGATARTAAGTVGRLRAGESSAVAAETVAEVVKNLRTSRLGKGFADWIELNWQKLLDNPKLRRPGAAAAPASGGSSGTAQSPSQLQKGAAEDAGPSTTEKPEPSPGAKGPAKRPTWRDSERDVGNKLGPDYQEQKSFKGEQEVPYGTKGSTRPDFYKLGESVEVKNYDVSTQAARDKLVDNVSNQAIQRAKELPAGTQQTLQIDVRGQRLSMKDAADLTKAIETKSGGAIVGSNITIVR